MTKFIGRLVDIGLARETSRLTKVAPKVWLRRNELDFDENFEILRSEAGVGNIAQGNQTHLTKRMSEGSVEGEIGSQSFGLILYSLLGSLSTATDTPVVGANTHDFTLDQTNTHPTLTLTKQDPDRTRQFSMMPSSVTITAEPGEIITYSSDLMGLIGNETTTQSVSYPDELKFLSRNVAFKTAANLAGLSGASTVDLKSLEVNIVQNVVPDDELGTLTPTDLNNTQFDVTGSITLNLEDDTFRDFNKDNTYRAMEIVLTSDGFITGTTNATLTLRFPRVNFHEWEREDGLDELVTQTLSFQAMYDKDNSEEVISTCELINGNDGTMYN